MKKKVLAFGASNSKKSINQILAKYAGEEISNIELEILDLNDYEMPIYSVDKEEESGIHPLAKAFKSKIDSTDGIIISFAEHNGNVSAAYKNIYDWVSRIDMKVFQNKPMFVLATSPGGRGGQGVLNVVLPGIKYQNSNHVGSFSLPSFFDNFKNGITSSELDITFKAELSAFEKAL